LVLPITCPPGFWGPLGRKALRTPQENRSNILKGLVLAIIGTAAVFAGTLAASDIFVGKCSEAGLFAGIYVVTSVCFLLWYRRLITYFEKRSIGKIVRKSEFDSPE